MTRSFSELIEDIVATLAEGDGESLAQVARDILGKDVEYNEDSQFTIKDY